MLLPGPPPAEFVEASAAAAAAEIGAGKEAKEAAAADGTQVEVVVDKIGGNIDLAVASRMDGLVAAVGAVADLLTSAA